MLLTTYNIILSIVKEKMGNCHSIYHERDPIFIEHNSSSLSPSSGQYRYYLKVNKWLEVCYCAPLDKINLITRNDLITIALAYDNEIKRHGLNRFKTIPCFNSSRYKIAHVLKDGVEPDLNFDINKWTLVTRPDGLTHDLLKIET